MLVIFLLFIIALTTYKIAVAEDVTHCKAYNDIKDYAKCRVTETWSEDEWQAFDYIVSKESRGWTVTTEHNPKLSSAYGLMGFLDSTWSTVDCVKTKDERKQVDCGIKYIQDRYTTANQAKKFHIINNWY